MNLGEFAIKQNVVTWVITIALLGGGYFAWGNLSRLEDPEFTIKQAVVSTPYPGASAAEVEVEVNDLLERAVQEMGQLKFVESFAYRGNSVLKVTIKDQYDQSRLPQVWDELRRKINDYQQQLPPGAGPSTVMDDFGDVYGVYVVLTGEGYSMAELKEAAKVIRKEVLQAQDVKKIIFWGDQREAIYVEMSRQKMAGLGITRENIYQALSAKNLPANAGRMRLNPDYVAIHPTGEFTLEQFGDLLVSSPDSDRLVRLKDVAEIQRGYVDPPTKIMRYDGQRGIALGISTVQGGNVVVMGEAIKGKLARLQGLVPIGMDINVVSLQFDSVTAAINGFLVNLLEAVAIVVVVLLIFMGLRSGLIIGGVLLLTIVGTFLLMDLYEVTLERISLGALVIALGMLVDNAIVVIDGMKVRIEAGMDRLQAASDIVGKNSLPLAGATAVAILAFAGIGVTQDQVGEYCRSLFTVILISLSLSWLTAVTTTPLLGYLFLSGPKKGAKGGEAHDPYGGGMFKAYKKGLIGALRVRFVTVGIVIAVFVASLVAFGHVKQMFFPDASRPQYFVDVFFPEGWHIEQTEAELAKAEQYLLGLDGVTGVATAIGGGDVRMLLTYTASPTSNSNGVIFVNVEDPAMLADLMPKSQANLADLLPDATVNTRAFRLGPGEGGRTQIRISGDDPTTLRELGTTVVNILKEEGAQGIRNEWSNKVKVVRPKLAEAQARQLGIERPAVAQAILANFDGYQTGVYREGDELLPIIARAPENERNNADNLNDLLVFSPVAGREVPLRQVVSGFETAFEDPILWRRNRWTTIKIHADPAGGELASELLARAKPRIEQTLDIDVETYFGKSFGDDPFAKWTAKSLPIKFADMIPLKDRPGYFMAWGGENESSAEAQAGLAAIVPVFGLIMVMIVFVLFNAVRQPLVIWLTVPLAIIGVTWGLLISGQPFGFMSLLGLLSLSGMIIKNSIVLIEEIDGQIEGGKEPFQAVVDSGVSRMRPVAMAAITTILGMIPLLTDTFFVAMAVTIMGGLLVATVLTLVVVPTLYVIFFRIKYKPIESG